MTFTQSCMFLVSVSLACAMAINSDVSGGGSKLELINTEGQLGDQIKCTSSALYGIVQDALSFYSGTTNAEGIAKRVTNNVLASYSGPWITFATQQESDTQWAYWGSSSIYTSQYFCLWKSDGWLIQTIRADLA